MNDRQWLAERFEANRDHLRGVAYRMLGSLSEADDAVQQAWLKVSRADTSDVANIGGWLTTAVARVCLDMLRSRKSRREDSLGPESPEPVARDAIDPETELALADSVGLAMLVVLETLGPAERIAFVLHDLFAVPFEEIGVILDRSPAAVRQLASRARRRVQGSASIADADLDRQREVVDAFLAAARGGDFDTLVSLLDPDVVLRLDATAMRAKKPAEIRGAAEVAKRAVLGGARAARPALVGGEVGVVVAPLGKLLMVLRFTLENGKIVRIEAVGDPERLDAIELGLLES
jgi:RNA polymerase sigma factor (sigma-70 family)